MISSHLITRFSRSFALFAVGCLISAAGIAAPILGAKLIYTGGSVTVETLPATAGITSHLDLYKFPGPAIVAGLPDFLTNHDVGHVTTFDPSAHGYAVGDELMFGILAAGSTFLMGEGSRNPDSLIHAGVDSLGGGVFIVGFEDLLGGGDLDYDDNVFRFTGGIRSSGVPEPGTMLILALGLAGLTLTRRRVRI